MISNLKSENQSHKNEKVEYEGQNCKFIKLLRVKMIIKQSQKLNM